MTQTDRRDVWLVMANTDNTEGRGRQYVRQVAETEATAIRLGRKGYVQGSDCPVVKSFAVKIGSTWFVPGEIVAPSSEDMATQERISMKRQAWEKAIAAGMTEDEIKALGSAQ